MNVKIKVRTSWGTTNSDLVLEQVISVNGETILELIYELDCVLFKNFPNDTPMVYREYFIESFSNPEIFHLFYDELVFYIGQIDSFVLNIDEDLKSYLNETQLKSHESGNDYYYGETVFESRLIQNKGVENWNSPWLTIN